MFDFSEKLVQSFLCGILNRFYIKFPSSLKGFSNSNTKIIKTLSKRKLLLIPESVLKNEKTSSAVCGKMNLKRH